MSQSIVHAYSPKTSSAITSVLVKDAEFVKITFKSSPKSYTYAYRPEFAEAIRECHAGDKSFGQLVSRCLKNGTLVPSAAPVG